ncbi:hypothetical protein LguiA_028873 [Lonicera macranthoides]
MPRYYMETLPHLYTHVEFYNIFMWDQWFEPTIINNLHLGSNQSTLAPPWTNTGPAPPRPIP